MMKSHQENIFEQQFYMLDENLKPFCFDILKALYYNNDRGFNIKEIYAKFENKHKKLIRDSIDKMEKLTLIQKNIKEHHRTEKRYFITKSGKDIVESHYNNIYNNYY